MPMSRLRETRSVVPNYKAEIRIANTVILFDREMPNAMGAKAGHKQASTPGYLQGRKTKNPKKTLT